MILQRYPRRIPEVRLGQTLVSHRACNAAAAGGRPYRRDCDWRRLKSVLSQINKSRCSKPSPTKRSSPSRTCGCSRKSRSAMRNCGRRWSIRRQRPRCSASSAARRRTCSRSSTPSSRAPPGFVGSMTWCCDSARETLWFRGLILVPYPSGRVEISIDEPQFRWMREHGTLHVPDVRAQNDFPTLGSGGWLRTFLSVPLRQQGELIGTTDRTSHRGAPLHPGADQATRNLRRSGRDRHRERPAVPRT